MKTFIMTMLLFIFTFAQNVSIIPFQVNNVSAIESEIATDLFTYRIVNSGEVKVVDRKHTEQILSEQGFQSSGCTDTECAVEIGKLLNVEEIFTGKLSKNSGKYFLLVNMISVETGLIIKSGMSSSVKLEETVAQTFNNLMRDKKVEQKQNGKVKGKRFVGFLTSVSMATAIVLPVTGVINYNKAKANYESANADFDTLWEEYSAAEKHRNNMYITGATMGAVGFILGGVYLRMAKKEKNLSFIPEINQGYVSVKINYNF